jgi:hypothetical protein
VRLRYQREPCRLHVANRILARGATICRPVSRLASEIGRSSRRSRRVSSSTRTAPLALAPRKPDPDSPVAGAGLCVGSEGPAEVNCGLLEHLRSNITTPWQARDLLGDGPVWGGDEDAPSGFAALPTIEGVDQVVSRPGHGRGRVGGMGTVRRTNELKALVVGEPRRPRVPDEHRQLSLVRSKRESEGGMPHRVRIVADGCDTRDISKELRPTPAGLPRPRPGRPRTPCGPGRGPPRRGRGGWRRGGRWPGPGGRGRSRGTRPAGG